MLSKVLGIDHIERLYLELLFRCNLRCPFCYHGESLTSDKMFSPDEVIEMAKFFRNKYKTTAITLLGGEPFIYPDINKVLYALSNSGFEITIITNGYKIGEKLVGIASFISELRVSVDGLKNTHDQLRRDGGFESAISALKQASALGVKTSVTMSLCEDNIDQVIPLSFILADIGVTKMDVHCTRIILSGVVHNAIGISAFKLTALDSALAERKKELPLPIAFEDEIYHPKCIAEKIKRIKETLTLDRINIQANGEVYLSCTFTGVGNNAFFYDKKNNQILSVLRPHTELDCLKLSPTIFSARRRIR